MKTKRMLNVDFFNDSSFKIKLSNKAKLLYFYVLTSADDKGFCNNVDEIVLILNTNDAIFHNDATMELLTENYETALAELLEKGFIIKFDGNHNNSVYLVRHWYVHNTIPKDRVTPSNYEKYLANVEVDSDGVYNVVSNKCDTSARQVLDKCDTVVDTNKIKLNKIKVNESKVNINKENLCSTSTNTIISPLPFEADIDDNEEKEKRKNELDYLDDFIRGKN